MNKSIWPLFILLTLILVGVIYYFAIYKVTEEELSNLDTEINNTSGEVSAAEARMVMLEEMAAEIEEGKQSGSMVCDYDNAKAELEFLSSVISPATDYNFSFEEPISEDGVYVRRNVSISFSCNGYSDAKQIVNDIVTSPYRTIFKDVTFTPINKKNNVKTDELVLSDDCEVSVVANLVFIETCQNSINTEGLQMKNN